MNLQPGILFHDRYLLQEMKGRGSFGEVWHANDQQIGVDVAIKVYVSLDTRGVEEFKSEFVTAFGLNHPNLLHAYYYDVCEDRPYLVMPYCPHSSVDLLGNMDENTIWRFIHDVASGLEYLHRMDIVHHDIKPDNILMDERGNFLITDFGISVKLRSTLRNNSEIESKSKTAGGAIPYMAPELFESNPASINATDIWALGASLYELITGELPFFGQGGVLQRMGAEIPEIHGNYSGEVEKIVKWCLAFNTWDRPMAKQLVKLSQAALEGEKININEGNQGTEGAKRLEEKIKAEEARKAEEVRRLEKERKAEEARREKEAEKERKAKEAWEAEEARRAEKERKAKEAREAEEARRAEKERKAKEAREAEEARRAEKEQKAKEAREAEEARRAEKERKAREAEEARRAEKERKAKEAREAEEARRAEKERKAKEAREAEEARRAEKERKAKEAREAEEARRAEKERKAKEAREAEEARRAEKERKVEEARKAKGKQEDHQLNNNEASPQPRKKKNGKAVVWTIIALLLGGGLYFCFRPKPILRPEPIPRPESDPNKPISDKPEPKKEDTIVSFERAKKMLIDSSSASKGLEMLIALADSGDYESSFLLSRIYYDPSIYAYYYLDEWRTMKENCNLQSDNNKAHQYLMKAYNLGGDTIQDHVLFYELGCDFCYDNRGVARNWKKARWCFERVDTILKDHPDAEPSLNRDTLKKKLDATEYLRRQKVKP